MSYNRVIQDSDDNESVNSDTATSVDPLQDEEPSIAAEYSRLNPFIGRRGRENDYVIGGANGKVDVEADRAGPPPSSGPPHVDFDQYLQSQSSIWGEREVAALSPHQDTGVNEKAQADDAEQRADQRGAVEDEFVYNIRGRHESSVAQTEQLQDMVPSRANRDSMLDVDGQKSVKRRKTLSGEGLANTVDGTGDDELPSPYDIESKTSLTSQLRDSAKHQLTSGMDGLAAAISGDLEVPAVRSKRGRPKKSSTFQLGEAEEIKQPSTGLTGEPELRSEAEPVKRAPGRPRKSGKFDKSIDKFSEEGIEELSSGHLDCGDGTLSSAPTDTGLSTAERHRPRASRSSGRVHVELPPIDRIDTLMNQRNKVKSRSNSAMAAAAAAAKNLDSNVENGVKDELAPTTEEQTMAEIENRQLNGARKVATGATTINKRGKDEPEAVVVDDDTVSVPKKRGRKRKKPLDDTDEGDGQSAQETETNSEIHSLALKESSEHQKCPDHDDKSNPPIRREEAETVPRDDAFLVIPSKKSTEHDSHEEQAPPLPSSPHSLKKPLPQYSPISKTSKVPFRVGLSRKARIAPLLKVVRK